MGFVDANGWQIALGELARHAQNGLTEPFQSDVDTLLTSSDGALIGDFLSADGAAAIIPALTKLASDCGATGQAARPTQTGSGPTESSSPVPVDPGESRPASWPPYEYAGPAAFDVCAVSDFPLAAPLVTPTNPAPGTAEYWAVMSAQAALRALNYGKPTVITADRYFGPVTARAVFSFQTNHGVPLSGAVESTTWRALYLAVHHWRGTCPT